MALTITNGGGAEGARILNSNPTRRPRTNTLTHFHVLFPFTPSSSSSSSSRTLHVISAAKKLSPRTGRFDSKNKRSTVTTKDQEKDGDVQNRTIQFDDSSSVSGVGVGDGNGAALPPPSLLAELPGLEPNFWEGEKWETFGFVIQYLWAFGVVFALVACGVAVATYNDGATDFKNTPAYKESIQSRELLEEPEASTPDIFESNPTEVAPSLE